jgi:hypothetical protein
MYTCNNTVPHSHTQVSSWGICRASSDMERQKCTIINGKLEGRSTRLLLDDVTPLFPLLPFSFPSSPSLLPSSLSLCLKRLIPERTRFTKSRLFACCIAVTPHTHAVHCASPQQLLLVNLSQALRHLTSDRREEQDIGAPLPAQIKVSIPQQLREHVSHFILNLILNRGHCRRLVWSRRTQATCLPCLELLSS